MTLLENFKIYQMNQCIDAGVRWLDGYFGREGWINTIETKRLDLSSGSVCMIGQLFQQKHQGMFDNFNYIVSKGLLNKESATRRGFYLPANAKFWKPDSSYYVELTSLWVEKIAKLRVVELEVTNHPTLSPIQVTEKAH